MHTKSQCFTLLSSLDSRFSMKQRKKKKKTHQPVINNKLISKTVCVCEIALVHTTSVQRWWRRRSQIKSKNFIFYVTCADREYFSHSYTNVAMHGFFFSSLFTLPVRYLVYLWLNDCHRVEYSRARSTTPPTSMPMQPINSINKYQTKNTHFICCQIACAFFLDDDDFRSLRFLNLYNFFFFECEINT